MGLAADRVRQLDERPVPRPGPSRLRRPGVQRHRRYTTAHLSGADETIITAPEDRRPARLAAQSLDGRIGRGPPCALPGRRPPLRARSRAVSVLRAPDRTAG